MLHQAIAEMELSDPPPLLDVENMPFTSLSGAGLDLSDVDIVITPLFGPGFDAMDLIEKLGRAQFRGRLRVFSKTLPNREMVIAELRALADPFDIIIELNEAH